MGDNNHALAVEDLGADLIVPVRKYSINCDLE